jgi:toxin ParE1/3/4
MRYVLSDFIESDLDEIASYIAKDSPRYALATIRKIRQQFRVISSGPFHYRLRPEIRPELREATMGRYVILFRVVGDVVQIQRVLHGGRDLPEFF